MSQRAGSFLFRGGKYLLSRLQSGGADNINIPSELAEELGDEQSVARTLDTPDISVGLESWDVNLDLEAMLVRYNPANITPGMQFDLKQAKPIDLVSPWKGRYGTFLTVAGVIFPYLYLEQFTYRVGVRQNATKQLTLRGDSAYYCQTTPYYKEFPAAGVGPYNFANTAVKTVENGQDTYAYCVTVHKTDGSWQRLVHGVDYTDTNAGFTLTSAGLAPAGSTVVCVYASSTQESDPQSIHVLPGVKPAAVRGRDVEVWISTGAATPTLALARGIQSAEVTWRVTLDNDEELGNDHYVARDYDVPDVSGNIVMRPADAATLMTKIADMQGIVSATQTLHALGFIPVELEIRIHKPDSATVLETIYVPDARFSPPPVNPRVGQKADFTFNFTSDTGSLFLYSGIRS